MRAYFEAGEVPRIAAQFRSINNQPGFSPLILGSVSGYLVSTIMTTKK